MKQFQHGLKFQPRPVIVSYQNTVRDYMRTILCTVPDASLDPLLVSITLWLGRIIASSSFKSMTLFILGSFWVNFSQNDCTACLETYVGTLVFN